MKVFFTSVCLAVSLACGIALAATGIKQDGSAGGGASAWVMSDGSSRASIDYFFANGVYFQSGVGTSASPASFMTTVRASTAYEDDLSGNWTSFGNNVLRVTNKGALIEESRTNSIRNNSMQGAVVSGSLPTNWTGKNNIGITAAVAGLGTENGIDYIDFAVIGTTNGNNGGVYSFCFEPLLQTAALNGQAWTASMFVKLQSGSLTNISAIGNRFYAFTGGGAQLSTYGGALTYRPTSATLSSQRISVSATITDATTAFVDSCFDVATPSGVASALNATFRIGWPQLELGAFVTSPIRTTAAAVTRQADVVAGIVSPTFGASFSATARFTPSSPVGNTSNQIILEISDSTLSNRANMQRAGTTSIPVVFWAGFVTGNNANFAYNGVINSSSAIPQGVSAREAATFTSTGTTLNKISPGGREDGNVFINGYLERMAIWPTVGLSNSALVTLTQ